MSKITYHLYFRKNGANLKYPFLKVSDKEDYFDIMFHLSSDTRPIVGDIIKLDNIFSAEIKYCNYDMENKDTRKFVIEHEKKILSVFKKYGYDKGSKFKISEIEFNFSVSFSCVDYNIYVDIPE